MDKLKKLLGEELFNKVKEKLGEGDYFFAKGKDFVPKTRLDEVNTSYKEIKKQLIERDNQLKELSKKAAGHEELTKQIQDLTEKNSRTVAEYEERLLAREKDYSINNLLRDSGARNIKAVKALLDDSKIEFVDGAVKGIEEQLNSLRQSDPYLFAESKMKSGAEQADQIGKTEGDKWAEAFTQKNNNSFF